MLTVKKRLYPWLVDKPHDRECAVGVRWLGVEKKHTDIRGQAHVSPRQNRSGIHTGMHKY